MKFKNQDLEKCYNVAKEKGYKCYGFQEGEPISQFFFEDEKGRIGTAHEHFSGIKFGTVHKSIRGSGIGTGFGIGEDFESPKNLDIAFAHAPNWAKQSDVNNVVKYKDWNDYLKYNTILTYKEI